MVAGLLIQRLHAAGLGDQVLVRSAGTYAEPGKPAWGAIGDVMAERGVDLHLHRSQPLSSEMVQVADLIIAMEEGHRQSIFYLVPRALRNVFLLSELSGDTDPYPDIMGHPLPEVRAACDLADQWLAAGWEQLLARLSIVEATAK